jgi:hypothetical protein
VSIAEANPTANPAENWLPLLMFLLLLFLLPQFSFLFLLLLQFLTFLFALFHFILLSLVHYVFLLE